MRSELLWGLGTIGLIHYGVCSAMRSKGGREEGSLADASERDEPFIFPDRFFYTQDLMDSFEGSEAEFEDSIVMISNQVFKIGNPQFGIRRDYSSVSKAPDLVDVKGAKQSR